MATVHSLAPGKLRILIGASNLSYGVFHESLVSTLNKPTLGKCTYAFREERSVMYRRDADLGDNFRIGWEFRQDAGRQYSFTTAGLCAKELPSLMIWAEERLAFRNWYGKQRRAWSAVESYGAVPALMLAHDHPSSRWESGLIEMDCGYYGRGGVLYEDEFFNFPSNIQRAFLGLLHLALTQAGIKKAEE